MRSKFILLIALMALASTLWAQSELSVLRLTGTGEVIVVPDTVEFELSVETQASTAAVATSENAQKMTQVIAQLREILDQTGSFKTSNYQLYPVYQPEQEQRNILSGYRVSNQIAVKTMNLKELGKMLDVLTKAGANQIQSLNFTHSGNEQLEQQALAKAIFDAKTQANFAADAAGVKILAVKEMELPDSRPGPFYRKNATMALEANASTPISSGDMTITKQVNMLYTIGPKN